MTDKLMYFSYDYTTQNNPFFSYNKWLIRLDTHLNDWTKQKSPKLPSQRIRKLCYKTFGTSVINSPNVRSLPSPNYFLNFDRVNVFWVSFIFNCIILISAPLLISEILMKSLCKKQEKRIKHIYLHFKCVGKDINFWDLV